jgi:hypothetical protein
MRLAVYFLWLSFLEIIEALRGVLYSIAILIFLPIIIPVVSAVNYIGTSFLRKRNGAIQVPTETYENPETGEQVVLVGMVHFADTEFYKETKNFIKILEDELGHTVLHEFQGNCYALDKNGKLFFAEKTNMLNDLVYKRMDKDDQRRAFVPELAWIITDIDTEEMFNLLGKSAVSENEVLNSNKKQEETPQQNDSELELLEEIEEAILKKCYEEDIYMSNIVSANVVMGIFGQFFKDIKKYNDIIVDKRNEIAFQAIMSHLEYNNRIVAIWGAAHLPGIGRMLLDSGFELKEKQWIPAYTIKNYPLRYLFGKE